MAMVLKDVLPFVDDLSMRQLNRLLEHDGDNGPQNLIRLAFRHSRIFEFTTRATQGEAPVLAGTAAVLEIYVASRAKQSDIDGYGDDDDYFTRRRHEESI